MQIVAQGAILDPASRSSPGRQVLWIQTYLYLADLNSEVAFRLHQNEKESLEWTGVRICGPGVVQDEFLPDLGQDLSQKRDFMIMKNLFFAVALLSVALWAGCATGGGGHTGGNIQVTVNTTPANQNVVAITLTVQFTADVTGTDNHTVTWSVSGANCTGNACGTIDSSGKYTAPAIPPTPSDKVNITATSVANPAKSDTYTLDVLGITLSVTPKRNDNSLDVVKGVVQQFTASATPDDARAQSFTWTMVCDAGPNLCGTLTFSPSTSYAAVYTAPNSIPSPAIAHLTATSTIDPNGTDTVDVTIVKSRLSASSTYAFHFSGFDASGPIAVAGNFATDSNGAIIGGTEDELNNSAQVTRTIDNTSTFTVDTNVHGSLTLHTSAGARTYKVVLNTAGDGQMIEFDGTGRRGSGEIAQATPSKFKNNALPAGSTFTFGMTGADTVLKRAGFVGLFKPDGAGTISSGLLDANDFGTAISTSNVTGVYDIAADGRGTMSLTNTDAGKTYNYAIYMVGGQTTKAVNPLTLFVISTDDPQVSPAVVGTIVCQDPTPAAYDNSVLNGFSVSNLTGLDSTGSHTMVSLTSAAGDGNGKTNGFYDANNAGTIVSKKTFSYPYAFTPGAKGRYTIDLLGDPSASPVVPPVHFVLYLNAANRGFLLDQSSQAVYTGTMDPQPGSFFAASELAGSLDAATASSGTPNVSQIAANFLFTSLPPTFTLGGQQDETDGGQHAGQTLAGTYTVSLDGTGTITLTAPGAAKYVIYVLDTSRQDDLIQHFVMMNVDPANTDSSIIFAER